MFCRASPAGSLSALVAGLLTVSLVVAADASDDKAKKPTLSLKANPAISFAPSRIFLTAELKDGPNDYEEYYCPTVEWDWGDGTRSESASDCEPYQPGKSEIKRRFAVEHVYRTWGHYKIQIRLKRADKVLVGASATVRVQPSLREPFEN